MQLCSRHNDALKLELQVFTVTNFEVDPGKASGPQHLISGLKRRIRTHLAVWILTQPPSWKCPEYEVQVDTVLGIFQQEKLPSQFEQLLHLRHGPVETPGCMQHVKLGSILGCVC